DPHPHKLEDLLEERRGLAVVHYLRRLYVDPMTGSSDWGEIKTPQGGIVAVYSKSTKQPIRERAILEDQPSFGRVKSYADWKFFARAAVRPFGIGPAQS